MQWILILFAGAFEVGGAIGLKYSQGFTRLWPSVLTAIAMTGSLGLLCLAIRHLPIGTAYAMWTGIGAVGTTLLGIVLFGESASPGRLVALAFITIGILGLKLVTPD
jgi:quaternary ammonium compound-resistance protein SugE